MRRYPEATGFKKKESDEGGVKWKKTGRDRVIHTTAQEKEGPRLGQKRIGKKEGS